MAATLCSGFCTLGTESPPEVSRRPGPITPKVALRRAADPGPGAPELSQPDLKCRRVVVDEPHDLAYGDIRRRGAMSDVNPDAHLQAIQQPPADYEWSIDVIQRCSASPH